MDWPPPDGAEYRVLEREGDKTCSAHMKIMGFGRVDGRGCFARRRRSFHVIVCEKRTASLRGETWRNDCPAHANATSRTHLDRPRQERDNIVVEALRLWGAQGLRLTTRRRRDRGGATPTLRKPALTHPEDMAITRGRVTGRSRKGVARRTEQQGVCGGSSAQQAET
jgi:hypothetical protein